MVRTKAPLTTIALLRKYRPMWADPHARTQFSHRSDAGRPHGSVRISSSLLNELSTAHASGNVVSSAQPTRNTCEKTGRGRATSTAVDERRELTRTATQSST